MKLEIESIIEDRHPMFEFQTGVSSLLQAIYDIPVPIHYKKDTFYEKIAQLPDLNIKYISFNLSNDYRPTELVHVVEDEEKVEMNKCYVDTPFCLLPTSIPSQNNFSPYIMDIHYNN